MTKDEAIEAGELAQALEQCDDALETVAAVQASDPLELYSLDIFDGDEDSGTSLGATVRVRPWLLQVALQTTRGVIVQRLAALGVEAEDPARG